MSIQKLSMYASSYAVVMMSPWLGSIIQNIQKILSVKTLKYLTLKTLFISYTKILSGYSRNKIFIIIQNLSLLLLSFRLKHGWPGCHGNAQFQKMQIIDSERKFGVTSVPGTKAFQIKILQKKSYSKFKKKKVILTHIHH